MKLENTCYINGQWLAPSSGQPWQLQNPADGSTIAELTLAGSREADAAVKAAAAAFPAWRGTPRAERAAYLDKIADEIERHAPDLASKITENNGKIRLEAEFDAADAAACWRYYADLIRQKPDCRKVPVSNPDYSMQRCDEPLGVCALITPWNFPLVTSAWKLAPALAAGCTAILKPSEFTLLPELELGNIFTAAGLPAGVANIIAGAKEAGEALTQHPLVDKVSFTGSNAVGENVMRQAADGVKNISLELGGKSAILITEDVDIDAAVNWIIGGFCFNAGQMCSATSRLLVPESIEKPLTEALIAKLQTLKTGSGQDPENHLGAITTQAQFDTIKRYLETAKREGLELLTGGAPLAGSGRFIPPTVYRNVPETSKLWNEEIFGPVLLIRSYRSIETAIREANAGKYGLVGTVGCRDTGRALEIARQIRAGHIWINSEQIVPPDSGWGGFKQSGIGRELGEDGLSGYLGSKHILIPKG